MTEPTPEPTESTMTVVPEETPPEPVEDPIVPYAPSFVALSPFYGQQAASIHWGEPNEGPADSYTVEADGKSIDVNGDVFRVDMGGLQPGQTLVATVTAHTGENSAGLSTPEATISDVVPEPDPAPVAAAEEPAKATHKRTARTSKEG